MGNKKTKTLSYYENVLRKMLEARKGKVDAFLEAQISNTAQCWRTLDRIANELADAPLTSMEYGSQGQTKTVLNPLLPLFDKASRTLKDNLCALGLNYEATPGKVNETDAPGEKQDPLVNLMNSVIKR